MTAGTGEAVYRAAYPGLVTPRPQLARPRRRAVSIALRVAGPLALLAGWWTASASGALNPAVLASPQQVASAAGQLWQSGQLQSALAVSLTRALIGLALGVSAGLILGVITGFSRLGEELLDSPLQLLRALPFLSLVPLFMVWFGIGETARVILIAVATTFPMYVSTAGGVRNIDPRLVEAMRSFGLSRWALVREVVLPSALPSLLSGLRLSMTLSVIALIAAEEINTTNGIGYLMTQAQTFSRTDILTVCVLIYGLMGLCVDLFARGAERLLMPWRPPRAAR
jgi:sulfonate transport system permease protein